MTMIGFIRHGITDWNIAGKIQGQTDIELNDQGRMQAKWLGEWLENEQWDIIYSSDLKRAVETGEIINEHLGLPIIKDERLREVHFGKLEGTTVEERIEKWGTGWRDEGVGKEEQESINERAKSLIQDIVSEHTGKRILLVSHGAFIANSLRYFMPQLDTTERIVNASLTIMQLKDGQWECNLYNGIAHLRND